MRLIEHADFNQAIIHVTEHFRPAARGVFLELAHESAAIVPQAAAQLLMLVE